MENTPQERAMSEDECMDQSDHWLCSTFGTPFPSSSSSNCKLQKCWLDQFLSGNKDFLLKSRLNEASFSGSNRNNWGQGLSLSLPPNASQETAKVLKDFRNCVPETVKVLKDFSKSFGISSDQRSNTRIIPSGSSPFDLLDEDLMQYIISKLPMPDLLVAQQTSKSWYRMISSCKLFQRFYDEVNKDSPETWLVLNSSAQSVPLFRTRTKDGKYVIRQWKYVPPIAGVFLFENPDWFLRATAKGLMLFSNSKGSLMLVQPLSKSVKLLPEAPLPWTLHSKHVRVFMSADSSQNTYQVVIFGEIKRRLVYALHYRSVTGTWDTAEVNVGDWFQYQYGLMRATFDGQMIWCHNEHYRTLQRYDVENKSVATWKDMIHPPAYVAGRKPCLGIFIYEGKVLILGSILYGTQKKFNRLFIWEANIHKGGRWEVFMIVPLDNAKMTISSNAVAAYDGQHSVSVIPKSGTKMIVIDLKQNRGIVLPYNPITLNENKNLYYKNRRKDALKAFYMKFALATQI